MNGASIWSKLCEWTLALVTNGTLERVCKMREDGEIWSFYSRMIVDKDSCDDWIR